MSFWKPESTREQMLRGTIAMEQAWEYDASKPMGNWARGMVSSTAEAHFVGIGNQMLDLCPRAIEWIDRAIERNEEFAGETHAYHQRLTAAKALAGWFSSGINVAAVWKAAFEQQLGLLLALQPRANAPWINELIDDLMACAVQGNCILEALAFYEDRFGSKPMPLKKVNNPRQFAYALCLQVKESHFEPAELMGAGRRILKKYLAENWLHNGQMIRAATWLKIVYWHADQSLTPEQTMLRAYDDMPTVPRPDFL